MPGSCASGGEDGGVTISGSEMVGEDEEAEDGDEEMNESSVRSTGGGGALFITTFPSGVGVVVTTPEGSKERARSCSLSSNPKVTSSVEAAPELQEPKPVKPTMTTGVS